MELLLTAMDESATFLVEAPFAALALVAALAFLCWWGATACDKGQELSE